MITETERRRKQQVKQSDCIACRGTIYLRHYEREGLVLKCAHCDAKTSIEPQDAGSWINLHPYDSQVVAIAEAAVGDYWTEYYIIRNNETPPRRETGFTLPG